MTQIWRPVAEERKKLGDFLEVSGISRIFAGEYRKN